MPNVRVETDMAEQQRERAVENKLLIQERQFWTRLKAKEP